MTSTPAASIRVSTSWELLAGPSVATILVARSIGSRVTSSRNAALLQDRHRRQGFAFEELQECTTRGRDVADAVGHAELVDGCNGVAPASQRKSRRAGDRLGELLRSGGEGVEFEHADRAVPDDRTRAGDDRFECAHALRSDVENEIVRTDVAGPLD